MDRAPIPRTAEDVAALEAEYRTFDRVSRWSTLRCDGRRWRRHADALREAADTAGPEAWSDIRERFLRAAALDSTALSELIRPVPDITTVVLGSSIDDAAWSAAVDATHVVVECHRRALVVASDIAAQRSPLDENSIAVLQDVIVEAQQTYTVSDEQGRKLEVDLPRRQYKPVTNYALRAGGELVPFAPADLVPREMQRLVAELASADFAELHPALQSAYLHMAITRIHPFADGNGRLARTLATIPLLRECGVPPLLLADQWSTYVETLALADADQLQEFADLYEAAHVNALGLARQLLVARERDIALPDLGSRSETPERILLDLVQIHLRSAVGVPGGDTRSVVTTASAGGRDRTVVRLAIADVTNERRRDIEFLVDTPDEDDSWLRVSATSGGTLDVWHRDVHPIPTEITHLRVRSWLDDVLRAEDVEPVPRFGVPPNDEDNVQSVRGIFVVGVPRTGTTLMGNYLGSHPQVLGLAEYGGFYVANSVAPAYVKRLPGREHDGFLDGLRRLAADHVTRVAQERGCTWFCDATPWNLEVAGALAELLPDAVFVLMLRHFSGAVLSLQQFGWTGRSPVEAAQLWVSLNRAIDQLPQERTLAVGYDAFAARPAEVVAGVREALRDLGLDPELLDEGEFATSHAAIVGRPRPTVATVEDGQLVFQPIASLDEHKWTPDVHEQVWPLVAETHQMLAERFAGVYLSPPRPQHVAPVEW